MSRRRYLAVPAHQRQPTPRLPGQLLCDHNQSLFLVEVDQAGAGDTRWAHSRPARRVVSTQRSTGVVCKRTGAGQTPGPFSVSRHPSFGGPPAAGRQRVFSWVASSRVVKSHLGSSDVVCHCGGTGDRGLFAPQSFCPGSSRRQGSHLPYTSVGLLS